MKKLFTLILMLSCIFVINAQVTESGKGFKETFSYVADQDFNDLLIDGVSEIGWLGEMDSTNEEYAEGAIVDGMLKITLQPAQEGSVGWGFTETMDLTDNPTVTFKYKFPEGTVWYFGAEDITGGWFETDDASSFVFGTDDLQEATIDLTTLTGEGEIDMTQISGIWILPTNGGDAAGDLYFDDVVIGEASGSTGINKVSVPSNLKIYPNPARTHIRIGVDAASIAIFNSVGQKVLSTTNYVKETPINVEELNSGIYFIKADSNTQKLIIK
jgi:nitrogen fixation protein FixH